MDLKKPQPFLVRVDKLSADTLRLSRYYGKEQREVADLTLNDASAAETRALIESFRQFGYDEPTAA